MRLSSILPTLTAAGMAMAAPTEKRQSGDFKGEMLAGHNFYRRQHGGPEQGVADLTWNDALESKAQKWAERCVFEHSEGGGENLAYHSGSATPATFVNMWGSERKDYNFNNGGFSSGTGHFTQVVWKGTTTVGCAQFSCKGGQGKITGLFVVCNYDPPGNYNNDYKNNVLKQTKGSLTDVYEAGKQPDKEPEQPPKEPEQPPKEPEQPPKEPEQPPKEPEQPPKEPEEPEDDCENEEGDPEWNQDGDQEGNQEGNQEWDWNNQDWQDQDWNHDDWNNKDWNKDWNNKDWSKYWNKE